MKYRVRIINQKLKKDSIVVDWHGIYNKFSSILELKQKLISTLSKYVPPASAIDEFNVGYFHGRPQVKSWILSEEDLKAMYTNAGDKEILLWCDGQVQVTSTFGRKRKQDDAETESVPKRAASSASGEEAELQEHVHELQNIHGDKYDYGDYRIWARMIKNHQWKDKDTPPNIPMIRGKVSRKGKHDVVDTLANAAVAIVKALRPSSPDVNPSVTAAASCSTLGMSPGKKVQLRSQYLKQLKEIQNLRDENVLSIDEFQAEKYTILTYVNLSKEILIMEHNKDMYDIIIIIM